MIAPIGSIILYPSYEMVQNQHFNPEAREGDTPRKVGHESTTRTV